MQPVRGATACALALAVVAGLWSAAAAADRVIRAVDPANVMQGDTVLLTITGENLPTGTVVVEFFPQQIAVLKVLSANDHEIVVQVKVPSLAPPGGYNIVAYNHLGDEAFGQNLLTVGSGLITPVFHDFDPKVIAEATNGFALMLTGDAITPGVIDHLSMSWTIGDEPVRDLRTTFGMGGAGTVVCAVNGKPPAGTLRGKVLQDGKPIYLVEVTVQGAAGLVVGLSPVEMDADQPSYKFRLLGTGFTAGFLKGLGVQLESPTTVAKATQLDLLDAASLQVTFSGPLPAGTYSLTASSGGQQVFSSQATLTLHAGAAGSSPSVGAEQPATQPQAPPAEGPAPPAAEQPPAPAESQPAAAPGAGVTQENQPAVQPAPSLRPAPSDQPKLARIDSVVPLGIAPGSVPCRFLVTGVGLDTALVDSLRVTLVVGDAAASLLFAGRISGGFACVFAPPTGGFTTGTAGVLTIHDPGGLLPEFTAQVNVVPPTPPAAGALETPQPVKPAPPTSALPPSLSVEWGVARAFVDAPGGASVLNVVLSPPSGEWQMDQLAGTFALLPKDGDARGAFANLSLSGDLTFQRGATGSVLGVFSGNFVSGDLLVRLEYGEGPVEASALEITAPRPHARVIAPPTRELTLREDGTLAPDQLQWVVDFAPFIVARPQGLQVSATPAPADAGKAFSVFADGTRIVITQDLQAWKGVAGLEGGLKLSFACDADVDWAEPPQFTLAVKPAPKVSRAQPILPDRPVAIDNEGFVIELSPGAEDVPLEAWEKVEVDTDFLLLARTIGKFQVQASEAEAAGQRVVRLLFKRLPAELPDMGYNVLIGELVAAEGIDVTLRWPELGCQAAGTLHFRGAAGDGEGVLEGLGLGAAGDGAGASL